jgi:3-oxoacyl-[acyl-carrier protein] reductase
VYTARMSSHLALARCSSCRYVEQLSQHASLTAARITANAVAPGFIETDMVSSMPFMIRNIGRRSNALMQGGLPEDIASLTAFLSSAEAQIINGETIRACGCNMVGR